MKGGKAFGSYEEVLWESPGDGQRRKKLKVPTGSGPEPHEQPAVEAPIPAVPFAPGALYEEHEVPDRKSVV